MSRKQKYDELLSRIGEVRAKIRKDVEEELALKNEEARAEGKLFWENNWMTPGESRKLARQLKIKDRIVLLELAVVTFLLGFSSYSLYFIMVHFLLPR